MKREIPAAFTWSLQDYLAFTRGLGLLRDKGHDSWIHRAGLLIFGHLFLVTGFEVPVLALLGVHGKNGPIPTFAIVISIVMSAVAAYFLFTKWYGRRWVANRAFQASQFRDLKASYLFGPANIESTNRMIQTKRSWNGISQVVEFRDAFILVYGDVGSWVPKFVFTAEWLPKHAFAEPFDDVRFAELAKELVKKYRMIDKNTFLRKDAIRANEQRQPAEPADAT